MGRRKLTDYDYKLRDMQELVSGMEGVCKPLAEDLLEAYVRVYADYKKLTDMLETDGLLVRKVRAGNEEKAKNPAFDMRRNCIAQMADLANKIKRFVKEDTASEEDEFGSF